MSNRWKQPKKPITHFSTALRYKTAHRKSILLQTKIAHWQFHNLKSGNHGPISTCCRHHPILPITPLFFASSTPESSIYCVLPYCARISPLLLLLLLEFDCRASCMLSKISSHDRVFAMDEGEEEVKKNGCNLINTVVEKSDTWLLNFATDMIFCGIIHHTHWCCIL